MSKSTQPRFLSEIGHRLFVDMLGKLKNRFIRSRLCQINRFSRQLAIRIALRERLINAAVCKPTALPRPVQPCDIKSS